MCTYKFSCACARVRVCASDGEAAQKGWNTYSDCGCLSSVSPWPAHGLLHLCNNKKWLTQGTRPGHGFSVRSTLQEGRNPFNSAHFDYMVEPGKISHQKKLKYEANNFQLSHLRVLVWCSGWRDRSCWSCRWLAPSSQGLCTRLSDCWTGGAGKQKTLSCQLQTTAV